MRIIREKTAAVCVDYQERILPVMTDPETLLQNTVKLLKGLRVLGVPVYLTQQYTKGLGDTVAPIREAAGTSEHLEKLTFSAYPQLREKLLLCRRVAAERSSFVISQSDVVLRMEKPEEDET